MGVSDPDFRKKVFGPRWQHEIEKHKLATLEKTHPSPATLPDLQTQWKATMSVVACFRQLTADLRLAHPLWVPQSRFRAHHSVLDEVAGRPRRHCGHVPIFRGRSVVG